MASDAKEISTLKVKNSVLENESPVDSGTDEISLSGGSSETKSSPSGSISADSAVITQDETKPQAKHNDKEKPFVKENTLSRLKKISILSWRKNSSKVSSIETHENKEMTDRERRLNTFIDVAWRGEISMEELADAGFYFSEKNGSAVCYKCNLSISDWKKGDKAKARHKKLNSSCEVVRDFKTYIVKFDARISSPASIPEDVDDGRSGLSNPGEFYKREFNRLVSYVDWPLSIPVDRYDLASSGLYSIRDHGGSDAVKCFACYTVIKDWKLGDRPKRRHASLSPSCPFVNNVPTGDQRLSDGEKTQIASLLRECEGGSLYTKSSVLKVKELSSEDTCPPSKTLKTDPFYVDACYPMYFHESKRLQTFQKWPHDHCQQPSQLSGAGFYSTGIDDEVQCFYCGGKLVGWESQDVPLTEHLKIYPTCKWALRRQFPVEEEAKFQTVLSSSHRERETDHDALMEELEKLQERSLCKVCLDGDADILFLPCKHLAVCKECTGRLELCPMCRCDIDEIIHVFIS